jgi:hypothetical protein
MNKSRHDPEISSFPALAANGEAPLFEIGSWQVKEMVLTWEKVDALWEVLKGFRSIFSDITRDDRSNFQRLLLLPDSYWLEGYESAQLNALMYFTGLNAGHEATAHMLVLDRDTSTKDILLKATAKWIFDHFPINRILAPTPQIYFATTRLLKRVGFKHEGTKRQAVLLQGRWCDIELFGLLRSEASDVVLVGSNETD